MTSFPSLRITAETLQPKGDFAVAQASFLNPDPDLVERIGTLCRTRNIGIVAHFYMDAELQGVLTAVDSKNVVIADSLKMADAAVTMAEQGVKTILVLGVDFMSENARAVLDAAGHTDVTVYRLASEDIGCSLAESAEGDAYMNWLDQAAKVPNSLHVVYINTSLETKAHAHAKVPTITCTSSNVVRTILQAASQIPDLHVWYGPDTYMGENLRTMFTQFTGLTDAAIRELHPAHDRSTIASLLERFHVFQEGNCVVHHMFGHDVVQRVREEYGDAYQTAHLEVPGEMFELAVEASTAGNGVVGSTSNILGFILDKVAEHSSSTDSLAFVLGTEAGMATSIVKKVQHQLREAGNHDLAVEIVFPVASEAVAVSESPDLGIIPGVAGGEGCSTAGGCATCPFMKMNTLGGMVDILEAVGTDKESRFASFFPRTYSERIAGRTAASLGSEPILHMRHFQTTGELPSALVEHVQR